MDRVHSLKKVYHKTFDSWAVVYDILLLYIRQEDVTNNRKGYPPDLDVNVPMDRGNMTKFMISNKNIYKHPNFLPANFNRWLEVSAQRDLCHLILFLKLFSCCDYEMYFISVKDII